MAPDTTPDAPIATEAAAAHAEELGVDLSTVEGTGKDGRAPTRPTVGTPELESVIDSVVALADNELGLVHEALEKELYQRRTQVAT
jgi:pyruvate/2-oxoglutarate dehydrogenase complex dihydrolipoamide acyltransferase (E2) component